MDIKQAPSKEGAWIWCGCSLHRGSGAGQLVTKLGSQVVKNGKNVISIRTLMFKTR